MAGAETIERLRQYLRELSPRARALLIGEFERSLLAGDDAAGTDLVLQELRAIVREQREGAPRIGHCARLFFKPLEPFLVDARPDHNHPGRIARQSLEPLWTWISRDLLPVDARELADDVNVALLARDQAGAEASTGIFQSKVAAAIEANLAAGTTDEKGRRRTLAQIGTPHAGEEVAMLKCVLAGRDTLAAMAAQLPLRIVDMSNGEIDTYKEMIENISAENGELFLYALLVVMNRLSEPWQIIRFGVKAAGSDIAARVAETHYGVTVTIVLAELERLVDELDNDLQNGRGIATGALLKTIHDTARGLRTELDLPVDSTWGRALSAQRARTAELLRLQIVSAPGRVRRLLRPRPSTEILANSVLDADEVAETETLLAFVCNCRQFAGELALNEMTQQACAEIQQYLDSGTRPLLDGLRHAGESDRRFRQSQVKAAVRFSAKLLGGEYAVQLAKAAEVAEGAEARLLQA